MWRYSKSDFSSRIKLKYGYEVAVLNQHMVNLNEVATAALGGKNSQTEVPQTVGQAKSQFENIFGAGSVE